MKGTRQNALAVARRFGFVLDESVSGPAGIYFMVTFDHPTHSIGGDCRSIHVEDYGSGSRSAAECCWSDAIERMEDEGKLLEPCTDADCDYHHEGASA